MCRPEDLRSILRTPVKRKPVVGRRLVVPVLGRHRQVGPHGVLVSQPGPLSQLQVSERYGLKQQQSKNPKWVVPKESVDVNTGLYVSV